MTFELKTTQDIIDFTTGCCFFGTGGGGDPKFGQQMLQDVIDAGKTIRIIDSSQLEDDSYTLCSFLMGSSGPDTPKLEQTRKFYGLTEKIVRNMPAEAAKLRLEQAKIKLGAMIPLEVGGAATASCLAAASWLDVPTINGDYAGGRSLPEISQMIPAIHGLKFCPLYSVDAYNNQVCILQGTNAYMEERLGKLVASASFSLTGQAGLLLQFKEVKTTLEKGTLSRAFQLGKAIRKANSEGKNVVSCIAETVDAHLILKGKVVESHGEELDNYFIGYQVIEGEQEFKSRRAKIWFKNEYLQLWLNDQPHVLSPDFICVVNYPSGQPLLNSQLKKDDRVAIFAVAAPPLLFSKRALCRLDPRHFGFNLDYVPFSRNP